MVDGVKGWTWTWFQALKVDSQPESAQTQVGRLMNHDHYHNYKGEGQERCDRYLSPLKVEIDQAAYQRMEMRRKELAGQMAAAQQQQQQQMVRAVASRGGARGAWGSAPSATGPPPCWLRP